MDLDAIYKGVASAIQKAIAPILSRLDAVEKTAETYSKAIASLAASFTEHKSQAVSQSTIEQLTETVISQGDAIDAVAELLSETEKRLDAKLKAIPAGEPGQDMPLVRPVIIRESTEYPKNTQGIYANSLWISTKITQGNPAEDPDAWFCIIAGICEEKTEDIGHQKYRRTLRMGDGSVIESEWRHKAPMWVGHYEENKTYYPGEVVTKGNAQFTCLEETDQPPPKNGWLMSLTARSQARKKPQAEAKIDG